MDLKNISIQDYTYHLPEEKIAKYPLKNREESRLLIYDRGKIKDNHFRNISHYLPENHLMVFNNAKVISARLPFQKETGAIIEIFCLEPVQPREYAKAFQATNKVQWKCLVGNLKKWKNSSLNKTIKLNKRTIQINVKKTGREDNYVTVEFTWDKNDVTFGEILDITGKVPIPPYLKRESEPVDKTRYQTRYSKVMGSVAAPTAGLHFDQHTLSSIRSKGIEQTEITLHVGAGTFRPVQSETVSGHEMHTEHFEVSIATLDKLIEYTDNLLSVGTTTLRTLESLYWMGLKVNQSENTPNPFHLGQWEHTELEDSLSVKESLLRIKQYMTYHKKEHIHASTQIMITPGYQFKLTDSLITNFHQPKSTLLLLIAAFVGDDWKKIYEYALNNNFRFLSYGDSSLLFP